MVKQNLSLNLIGTGPKQKNSPLKTFYFNLGMAFDGFGGVGGHLAQQLEAARSTGTGHYSLEASTSLSVSFWLLIFA